MKGLVFTLLVCVLSSSICSRMKTLISIIKLGGFPSTLREREGREVLRVGFGIVVKGKRDEKTEPLNFLYVNTETV